MLCYVMSELICHNNHNTSKRTHKKNADLLNNMYVRPRNTRTEMYAGRVACCPLMSHVAYALQVLLTSEQRRRTPI